MVFRGLLLDLSQGSFLAVFEAIIWDARDAGSASCKTNALPPYLLCYHLGLQSNFFKNSINKHSPPWGTGAETEAYESGVHTIQALTVDGQSPSTVKVSLTYEVCI